MAFEMSVIRKGIKKRNKIQSGFKPGSITKSAK